LWGGVKGGNKKCKGGPRWSGSRVLKRVQKKRNNRERSSGQGEERKPSRNRLPRMESFIQEKKRGLEGGSAKHGGRKKKGLPPEEKKKMSKKSFSQMRTGVRKNISNNNKKQNEGREG